ncbi:hypothetical protein Pelo_17929 [Pelomyxa schiedti]|nr:hypothetical protein Pelo_17929 [Pelomyxa schiedti]
MSEVFAQQSIRLRVLPTPLTDNGRTTRYGVKKTTLFGYNYNETSGDAIEELPVWQNSSLSLDCTSCYAYISATVDFQLDLSWWYWAPTGIQWFLAQVSGSAKANVDWALSANFASYSFEYEKSILPAEVPLLSISLCVCGLCCPLGLDGDLIFAFSSDASVKGTLSGGAALEGFAKVGVMYNGTWSTINQFQSPTLTTKPLDIALNAEMTLKASLTPVVTFRLSDYITASVSFSAAIGADLSSSISTSICFPSANAELWYMLNLHESISTLKIPYVQELTFGGLLPASWEQVIKPKTTLASCTDCFGCGQVPPSNETSPPAVQQLTEPAGSATHYIVMLDKATGFDCAISCHPYVIVKFCQSVDKTGCNTGIPYPYSCSSSRDPTVYIWQETFIDSTGYSFAFLDLYSDDSTFCHGWYVTLSEIENNEQSNYTAKSGTLEMDFVIQTPLNSLPGVILYGKTVSNCDRWYGIFDVPDSSWWSDVWLYVSAQTKYTESNALPTLYDDNYAGELFSSGDHIEVMVWGGFGQSFFYGWLPKLLFSYPFVGYVLSIPSMSKGTYSLLEISGLGPSWLTCQAEKGNPDFFVYSDSQSAIYQRVSTTEHAILDSETTIYLYAAQEDLVTCDCSIYGYVDIPDIGVPYSNFVDQETYMNIRLPPGNPGLLYISAVPTTNESTWMTFDVAPYNEVDKPFEFISGDSLGVLLLYDIDFYGYENLFVAFHIPEGETASYEFTVSPIFYAESGEEMNGRIATEGLHTFHFSKAQKSGVRASLTASNLAFYMFTSPVDPFLISFDVLDIIWEDTSVLCLETTYGCELLIEPGDEVFGDASEIYFYIRGFSDLSYTLRLTEVFPNETIAEIFTTSASGCVSFNIIPDPHWRGVLATILTLVGESPVLFASTTQVAPTLIESDWVAPSGSFGVLAVPTNNSTYVFLSVTTESSLMCFSITVEELLPITAALQSERNPLTAQDIRSGGVTFHITITTSQYRFLTYLLLANTSYPSLLVYTTSSSFFFFG